jgi:hypothetical protein
MGAIGKRAAPPPGSNGTFTRRTVLGAGHCDKCQLNDMVKRDVALFAVVVV